MSRYFAGKPNQPRARRAVDAIAIVIGLLLVAWTALLVEQGLTSGDGWILDLFAQLPSWFEDVWKVGYFFGLLMVVALFIVAIVQRRLDLVRDMGLAIGVAVVAAVLLALWLSDSFPTILPELTRPEDPDLAFPISR